MTSAALMIHLGRCIAAVHLAEFEQTEALVKVLYNDFAQVLDHELLPLGLFDDLEWRVRRRKFFIKQVKDLIVINLEVAALDDEDSLFACLTQIDLSKELLETVNQDSLVLEVFEHGRVATLRPRDAH